MSERPAHWNLPNLSPLRAEVLGVNELAAEILAGDHPHHPAGQGKKKACEFIQDYCKGVKCQGDGFWLALAAKLEIPLKMPAQRPTWLTHSFMMLYEYRDTEPFTPPPDISALDWPEPQWSAREWIKGWCQMLCQKLYFHSIAGATTGITQPDIIRIMEWLQRHSPHLLHPTILPNGQSENESKYQYVIQNAVGAGNIAVLQWFLTQHPKYLDLTNHLPQTNDPWISATAKIRFQEKMKLMRRLWWDSIRFALMNRQLPGALWVWNNVFIPYFVPHFRHFGEDDLTQKFAELVAFSAVRYFDVLWRPSPARRELSSEQDDAARVSMLEWLVNSGYRDLIINKTVPSVYHTDNGAARWLIEHEFMAGPSQ